MEPHPGLLSQVEAQHRINRYQSLEISSQRHQITALTEQATAAAAGLTTADLDRREAIARYDLLHADYAIKITQVQHLRAALQQRDAAIRRQQDEIAALEKRVRDLQQDLTIPAQEAETMAAPPSVITPPPSRGRLSQMAAASVPSLPAVGLSALFIARQLTPLATRQIRQGAAPQGELRQPHDLAAREVRQYTRDQARRGPRTADRRGRVQAHDAAGTSVEESE